MGNLAMKTLKKYYYQIIDESIRGDMLKVMGTYFLILQAILESMLPKAQQYKLADLVTEIQNEMGDLLAKLVPFFKKIAQEGIYVDERVHAFGLLAVDAIVREYVKDVKLAVKLDGNYFLSLYLRSEFVPRIIVGLMTIQIINQILNDRSLDNK